jgi:hypothetical protein
MDLYPKNQTILKKLLAKRQNPSTQACQSQTPNLSSKLPSNPNTSLKGNLKPVPIVNASSNTFTQPQVVFNANTIIIVTSSQPTTSCTETTTCSEGEGTGSEDGGSGDRGPYKKLKTTPTSDEKPKRSNCFEEEGEISTTYETNSDGNSNEFSDYYSPSMGCHLNRDIRMEEFRLDDEDCGSCSGNARFETMSNSSEEDSVFYREVLERTGRYEGKCLSNKCSNHKASLQFQCKYKHHWEMSLEDMRDEKWCPKCHTNLRSLQEFAAAHGGRVTNTTYGDLIVFTCSHNHTWSTYHKNAKRKWCSQCMKDEKEQMKSQFEQERQKKQTEDEERQKRLFEEAKRKAMENMAGNCRPQAFPVNNSSISPAEYYRKMEFDIETLAKKYTTEFMSSKDFTGQCEQQQIFQVYKILVMPEEILKSYMFNLPTDALKAEFRRLAKLIHPDKNKHPKSGLAFQKIHRIYEASIGKLDSSNAHVY